MNRYLKAAAALLSLPALITARSTFYARNAEAKALAGPEAYPDALANAYIDSFDDQAYFSKRDVDEIVYFAKRDAYAEAYANALALTDSTAEFEFGGFSVQERSPVPTDLTPEPPVPTNLTPEPPVPINLTPEPLVPTDLTPEQKKKCIDLKNKATGRYKQAQREFDAAVRAYNQATAQNKKAEAAKAYAAAKR